MSPPVSASTNEQLNHLRDRLRERLNNGERFAGTAVALFSLRGADGRSGTFPMLGGLAPWMSRAGLVILQILPVNDTGHSSSPYNLLSSFALNPVYIDLDRVLAADSPFQPDLRRFRGYQASRENFGYNETYSFKLALLKGEYLRRLDEAASTSPKPAAGDTGLSPFSRAFPDAANWRRSSENKWLFPYSLFCALRDDQAGRPWWEWPPEWQSPPAEGDASLLAGQFRAQIEFYQWLQFLAHVQLKEAAADLAAQGVVLKGDLPFLLNRNSCDVWQFPDTFDLDRQVGAPPDQFSPTGQNWGFPALRYFSAPAGSPEAGPEPLLEWWRQRLEVAGHYYGAIRLDHMLGLFRLWCVPASETSGLRGSYRPQVALTFRTLTERLGFTPDEVDLLSRRHASRHDLEKIFGPESLKSLLDRYFDPSPVLEDHFVLKVEMESERALAALPEPADIREGLLNLHRYPVLLADGPRPPADVSTPGTTRGEEGPQRRYYPSWFWHDQPAWHSISPRQRKKLNRWLTVAGKINAITWRERGRDILESLKKSSPAIICGEDLGAVPPFVPPVLEELRVFGLRVERWSDDPAHPGHPLTPGRYPYWTVATTSTHDTSTLRQWQAENHSHHPPNRDLRRPSTGRYSRDWLSANGPALLKPILSALSALAIPPLQDFFLLETERLLPDEGAERINIPGTTGWHNWSYIFPGGLPAFEVPGPGRKLADAIRDLVKRAGRATKID